MTIEKSNDMELLGIFNVGKAFRFLLAALALVAISLPLRAWAASADGSPCPVVTLPIQVMIPGAGSKPIRSAAEIPNDPNFPDDFRHFRAFVAAITEHVTARLDKDKLCIHGSERMGSTEWPTRSWFQFVHWPLSMRRDYPVPVMDSFGVSSPPSCEISSPWIDLVVDRMPVPLIRGIVYWNERQLLVDQAILAGGRNVPPGRATPLTPSEYGRFLGEYEDAEFSYPRKPTTGPLEERIPPELLWLLRRSGRIELAGAFKNDVSRALREATEKGVKGYTKLVIALIDRCFASSASGRANLHYNSILDVADPIRIDMPILRRSRFR
jgi:hypothetical protein